jgi:hypothetical protein
LGTRPCEARRRQEAGGLDHGVVGQPHAGERFVIAHLALGQRDDRLEIEFDAAGLDRLPHHGLDLILGLSAERSVPDRNRARGGRHCVRYGRGRFHARRQRGFVHGDRLGEILHEFGQVADLPGERFDRGIRIGDRDPFDRGHAVAQFADFAGDIGGGTGQTLHAIGNIGAVAAAGRRNFQRDHGNEEHETEQSRLNRRKFRQKIQDSRKGGRDQRHAGRQKQGTVPAHARPH